MEDPNVWKANYTPETKELLKKLSKAKLMIIPSLPEVDMSGYKSPIEVIMSDMVMKEEDQVMQAVWNVGVNVDKEELVRALAYDRDQYAAGYQYAKEKYDRPHGEWLISPDTTRACCPFCHHRWRDTEEIALLDTAFRAKNFCEYCGADMRPREGEQK